MRFLFMAVHITDIDLNIYITELSYQLASSSLINTTSVSSNNISNVLLLYLIKYMCPYFLQFYNLFWWYICIFIYLENVCFYSSEF